MHEYTLEECKLLIRNLLESLICIHHHNIVHLDLKPENIVLVSNSNNTDIKLIDFGLSAKKDQEIQSLRGTPEYASLKMTQDWKNNQKHKVNESDDIWSTGIILLDMLTNLTLPDKYDTVHISKNLKSGDIRGICLKPNKEIYDMIENKFYPNNPEEFKKFQSFIEKIFGPITNNKLIDSEQPKVTAAELLQDPWLEIRGGKKISSKNMKKIIETKEEEKNLRKIKKKKY